MLRHLRTSKRTSLLFLALSLIFTYGAHAELLNIWHIPDANEGFNGDTMRFPLSPMPADDEVFIHVGVFPTQDANGGMLHYRGSNEGTWNQSYLAFSHNSPGGENDYWFGVIPNGSYATGDTLYYYAEVSSDTGKDTTFVYQDVLGNSATTIERTLAALSPFSYSNDEPGTPTPAPTSTETPLPTATPTPSINLLNAWHYPKNGEGVGGQFMRFPNWPNDEDDSVTVTVGVNPKFAMDGGTVWYREAGAGVWAEANFTYSHDNPGQNNDYWSAQIDNSQFAASTVVEYFCRLTSDTGFVTTYVHGDENMSFTASDRAVAEGMPFSYTVRKATAAPTNTPGPTMTPTPQPSLMNAWHIPDALEGLNGDTMRYPLMPTDSTDKAYIHVGVNPKFSMNGGTLYYRAFGDMNWSTSDYFYSHDNVGQNNDYWVAELNNTMFMASDTVEYFAMTSGDSYADTYVYWDGNASMTTGDMTMAATNPFSYALEMATPTPTPTDGPTMTPTPQPSLMTAWHIPDALEGLNGDTHALPANAV